MTRTLVVMALGTLFVLRADPSLSQADADPGKPRIELFWSDYKLLSNKMSAGARKAIESEAREIFADAGVALGFFAVSPVDINGLFS